MPIPVTLEWYEVQLAAQVGVQRQLEALRQQRPDRAGFRGDGWGVHIEGAAGEMAFAKAAGRYWGATVNTFRFGGDVGDIQVRTRSDPGYEMLIRPNDRNDDVFYLVTGRIPEFTVVGWIRGAEAKRPRWLAQHGDRPAAYFVPHDALHSTEQEP